MATSSQAKVSLKLLIDTKAKKVLFAEAGKDFVDFLFNLLHLPVGTVVRLLAEQTMVGTLGNLYESIQNLSENYFQSNSMKDFVLKPHTPVYAPQVPLLSFDGGSSVAKKYYTCSANGTSTYKGYYTQYHGYVGDNAYAVCPTCKCKMSQEIKYVAEANEAVADGEGFVKGVVTYMVMDDLVVTPLSSAAMIAMLNKFNVKEGSVEERVVDLELPEGLKLLKASLHSKTVLTSVFLEKTDSGIEDGEITSTTIN